MTKFLKIGGSHQLIGASDGVGSFNGIESSDKDHLEGPSNGVGYHGVGPITNHPTEKQRPFVTFVTLRNTQMAAAETKVATKWGHTREDFGADLIMKRQRLVIARDFANERRAQRKSGAPGADCDTNYDIFKCRQNIDWSKV